MGELRQHRAPATEPLPVADDTAIAQIARLIVGTERLDVPVADLALPAHGLHDPQVLLSRRAAIAQHEHLMLNHHIEVEEARTSAGKEIRAQPLRKQAKKLPGGLFLLKFG